MRVLMAKPEFETPIVELRKQCSIRPPREDKRDPRPGEALSIRVWQGKPYRSKQREILQVEVVSVDPIRVDENHLGTVVIIGDRYLNPTEIKELAVADGFRSDYDFRQFFEKTHGLPFSGFLIKWRPLNPRNHQSNE